MFLRFATLIMKEKETRRTIEDLRYMFNKLVIIGATPKKCSRFLTRFTTTCPYFYLNNAAQTRNKMKLESIYLRLIIQYSIGLFLNDTIC